MSFQSYKAGVYFVIPGLKNLTRKEIVKYFTKLECMLEDPDDIHEAECYPLYFKQEVGLFHPRNVEIDAEGNTQQILECPLSIGSIGEGFKDEDSVDPGSAISVSHANKIAKLVEDKLNICIEPIIFSYSWWNAEDESFHMPSSIKLE